MDSKSYKMSCAEACYASKLKRFCGGYLLDMLLCEVPVYLLFAYVLVAKFPVLECAIDIYALCGVPTPKDVELPTFGSYVQSGVIYVVLFIYYILMELILQTTVGKMAVGTVVVDKDGNKPAAWRILVRTLCRAIPFDNFSFLFSWWDDGKLHGAWHDKISGTYVVERRLLEQWQAGNYDGSDKFGAYMKSVMDEANAMQSDDADDQDEQDNGRWGRREEPQEPGRVRVEDLYPSDDPNDADEQ